MAYIYIYIYREKYIYIMNYIYIYIYIYYSAIRKNEILPFATTTWMELEGMMLKETSQSEKRQIRYDFTHICDLRSTTHEGTCGNTGEGREK